MIALKRLAILVFLGAPVGARSAERIVVFEFRGLGNKEIRAEMVRVARSVTLARAGVRFDVMDPETIAARGSDLAQCTGDECEIDLAGALGAAYAVVGFVTPAPAGAVLEVKVFAVRNSRLLGAESTTASSEPSLLSATEGVVRKALDAAFARLEAESTASLDRANKLQWELDRAKKGSRRTLGWFAAASGLSLGAAAGVFAYLGTTQNASIKAGGLGTAADIKKAADAGKTYNAIAYASGGAGALLLTVGAGLVISNRDPGAFTPMVQLGRGMTGLAVEGKIP